MKVTVNGDVHDVPDTTTILDVVRDLGTGTQLGIAVAVNGEVITKKEWGATTLEADDHVEVLRAIGGG